MGPTARAFGTEGAKIGSEMIDGTHGEACIPIAFVIVLVPALIASSAIDCGVVDEGECV